MTVSHAAPQRLGLGQTVLNYRVLRELGSRAAPVYAAHRIVAGRMELSVLQHFRRPRDAVQQLTGILRDARSVGELSHPNLMRVHGAEPVGEEIVVASEFVEGEALSELRVLAEAQGTKIPLQVQMRFLLEVLGGLAALHDTRDPRRRPIGLFHGLLAPTEIMAGLDGVARVVGIFHSLPLRIPTDAVPHVAYFAPEVLHSDRPVDKRADVYSVGVLLWEALSGERLFKDLVDAQILARHATEEMVRPKLAADDAWAEPLVDVAMKALTSDPKGRYESAEEMLAAMQPHAKVAPQTTVAMLVRQIAGEKILKRRGEFAQIAAKDEEDDTGDSTLTAVSPPTRASGVERRGEDTVTTTVSEKSPITDPLEDSITKAPPLPSTLPEYADNDVTTQAPAPTLASPSADAPPTLPADLPDDSITAVAPSLVAQGIAPSAPSPPSSSAARAITPAAGSPPRPPSKPSLPEPKTPQRPRSSPGALPPAIEEQEDLVTEVRPTLGSEADAADDSVTRQAPLVPDLRPRDDEDDGAADTTAKRPRKKLGAVEHTDGELQRDSRDEEIEEDCVTAVAPAAPVLPEKNDESITQDRPPVARSFAAARRSSVPSVATFPPPNALPGPSSFPSKRALPAAPAVVAVDVVSQEDALGETIQFPPEAPIMFPAAAEPSTPSEEYLPAPSYKRLGIALAFAFLCAFALLVYVIVRATNQEEPIAPAPEARSKAVHGVEAEDGPETVARKGTAQPVATPPPAPPPPPPRRWWPPPRKR